MIALTPNNITNIKKKSSNAGCTSMCLFVLGTHSFILEDGLDLSYF